MKEVDKGTRAINCIVDLVLIAIVASIFIFIFQLGEVEENLLITFVFVTYYFCFESFYGRTPGKMVTNTVVLNTDNSRPGKFRILLRTLLRLNPFDGISYLFGIEQGTHDYLSKTRLKSHRKE